MKTKRVLAFLLVLTVGIFAARAMLGHTLRAAEKAGISTTETAVTEAPKPGDAEPKEPATEALATEAATETEAPSTEILKKEPVTFRIAAVGDIMFHMPQVEYAQTGEGYDFNDSFALVAPYIRRADFAIGNFETTSTPDMYPYSGYPMFNTPPQSIDAIKEAGFDALSTANNHCIDTYDDGIASTIREIRARGLYQFGTHAEAGEPIETAEVKGVKIAMLSYTYGFNGMEQTLTDEQYNTLVEPLSPEKIKADIERAREEGAELVILYPHWGIEYNRMPSQEQQDLAHSMAEWGADLVLGSHPHVVQPQEWVRTADGRKAYIIYSMGNFLSGQRLEYNEDIHVEQSVLLDIGIERTKEGQVIVSDVQPIPLWVDRTDNGLFRTVAAADGLGEHRDLFADWKIDRIQRALDDTNDVLGWDVGE